MAKRASPKPRMLCEPVCVECGGMGRLTAGRLARPHEPHLWPKMFFVCTCGAMVTCHPGTAIANGRPGNVHTRKWRRQAHEAFDPLWQREGASRRNRTREKAYRWPASQLGIAHDDCHIGRFDEAMCRRVIAVCSERKAAA